MAHDDDLDDIRDRFLQGGCHALALALSEATGWPMVAIWLRSSRREEIAHVAVVEPGFDPDEPECGTYLDVGGLRELPEILDDLEADEEDVRVEVLDAAGVRALTRRSRPSHRKLPDLTAELLAEAAEAAPRVLAAAGMDDEADEAPAP